MAGWHAHVGVGMFRWLWLTDMPTPTWACHPTAFLRHDTFKANAEMSLVRTHQRCCVDFRPRKGVRSKVFLATRTKRTHARESRVAERTQITKGRAKTNPTAIRIDRAGCAVPVRRAKRTQFPGRRTNPISGAPNEPNFRAPNEPNFRGAERTQFRRGLGGPRFGCHWLCQCPGAEHWHSQWHPKNTHDRHVCDGPLARRRNPNPEEPSGQTNPPRRPRHRPNPSRTVCQRAGAHLLQNPGSEKRPRWRTLQSGFAWRRASGVLPRSTASQKKRTQTRSSP